MPLLTTSLRHVPLPLVLLAALVGCVQDVGLGPDLGPCSEPPSGAYGYGDIGIGSCLAGPVDLEFVERDGRSWLAVANAAPFYNFTGGSVLLVDWDDLSGRLANPPDEILVSDLVTDPIPTERFISAVGWVPARDELIVTRRLTEGGRTRAGEDSAYVVDLGAAEVLPATLPLRDDPGDVVVDAASGRAYILNWTDHSISVLDIDDEVITPIDLAPEASLTALPFDDADDSGSIATLDRLTVNEPTDLPSDLWTLRWMPGNVRVYLPDGEDLDRGSTGGDGYLFDPLGDNVDLDLPIWDPVIGLVTLEDEHDPSLSGLPIYFASGGSLYSTSNSGTLDDWSAPAALLDGIPGTWQAQLAGPSVALIDDTAALFYAGTSDDAPGSASIGVARPNASGLFVASEEPVFQPPEGQSYEQPFAQIDEAQTVGRVWMSHHDGERYRIVTATFDDLAKSAFSVGPVEVSLELPTSIAAPVVRYYNGQYHLWASRDDGTRWTFVATTSADGIAWGDLTDIAVSTAPYDPRRPPRVAVRQEATGAWRIEGRDLGVSNLPALAGVRTLDLDNGFSFSVAHGQELENDALFPLLRASSGVVPTSHVTVDGTRRLYVSITGDDGRSRLAVIDDATGEWDVLRQDLIPQGTGGNVAGVSAPVVYHTSSGAFVMYYAAEDANGQVTLRASTSDDGVWFTPLGDAIEPTEPVSWASGSLVPHAIEPLDDGDLLLWFSGNDGSRWRVGALRVSGLVDDPTTATHTPEVLDFTDFQLGPGIAGGADDSGVKDPVVVQDGDERVLWYSGFDGTRWSIARAVWDGVQWKRRTNRESEATLPAIAATRSSFAVAGVQSPVWGGFDAAGVGTLFFSGDDTADPTTNHPRLGRATTRGGRAWPVLRQPTVGDTLAFESQRGDQRVSVIELEQTTEAFYTSGTGTTRMILDEDAGMLYVPSKLSNLLYTVDVREDVSVGRPDANAFDVETVFRFETVQNTTGFRGAVLDPARDRLYLTIRNPDAVAVLDTRLLEDDDDKEVTSGAFLATLPLQNDRQDRGADSVAAIGGAQPLLTGDLLIVPNFSDNSLSVFDVSLGVAGEAIAHVPWVGENPHIAALSPDGRWAVIANYLGTVEDQVVSSTLALLDLDPASPTYLTIPTRIVNR